MSRSPDGLSDDARSNQISIATTNRASVLIGEGARVSPPKKVVLREGGRHGFNEKLQVMESDRTSPMLRSIQSQYVLKMQN